jgi:putative membrane protein
MMYHGYGMGAGWALIIFAMVLPALLIVGGLILAQIQRNPVQPYVPGPSPDSASDAERILADRLARGEIDGDDYSQRLRTLRAGRR